MTYGFLLVILLGAMGSNPSPVLPSQPPHHPLSTLTSREVGSWEARWAREAPHPHNLYFKNFFSAKPSERLYRRVLHTLRLLVKGLEGQPIGIQKVLNAYRHPAYNRRIGGDRHSYHIRGKAIDFLPSRSLSRVKPSVMERVGRSLNKQGLRVIWYPFASLYRGGVHVQIDHRALKYRRIFYRGRRDNGYYSSYRQAKYARPKHKRTKRKTHKH